MADKKRDFIDQKLQDLNNDGVDRRGFLKCMAWAGTGLVWTMSGGIPVSHAFDKGRSKSAMKGGDFSFVQISDSHIGFNKPANPDVTATLQTAIDRINALPHRPDFLIHTGDLSQLSKPSEFDTLDQASRKLMADPDMIKFLEDIAAVPTTDTSPERTAKFIKDEIAKWAPVIRAAGVQIE